MEEEKTTLADLPEETILSIAEYVAGNDNFGAILQLTYADPKFESLVQEEGWQCVGCKRAIFLMNNNDASINDSSNQSSDNEDDSFSIPSRLFIPKGAFPFHVVVVVVNVADKTLYVSD